MSATIRLLKDYSPNVLPPITPGNSIQFNFGSTSGDTLSQYELDYFYVAFNEIIRREITSNADIIYNNNFQNFMVWVLEYGRILKEARSNDFGKAREPFGTNIIQVLDPIGVDHFFDNGSRVKITDKIYHAVFVASPPLNPKIYTSDSVLKGLPYNLPKNYYEKCNTDYIKKMIAIVIIPMVQAYNAFVANPSVPTSKIDNSVFEELSQKISESFALINDSVTNGDYDTRYTTLQVLLNNSVSTLENLAAASNTEINIIQQSADIDNYYEKLDFKPNDLTVIVPTTVDDKIDLVDKNAIYTDLKKSISRYSSMSTSDIIASTYNVSTGIKNIKNASINASNLLNVISTATNITSPSQKLLNLVSTKIYNDDNNNPQAKYLTDQELALLKTREIANQNRYLDLIDAQPQAITAPSGQTATNRVARYSIEYPKQQYGGRKVKQNKTYRYAKKSTQNITISQSGGDEIGIDKLISSNKKSSIEIDDLSNNIDENNKLYQLQNESYFDNINFVDIDNLEQRNDYLIEMMNILILHNFLLGNTSTDYQIYFDQMKNKIDTFRSNLTDMWNLMQSRTAPPSSDAILSKFLSNGAITISEIQSLLLSSIGIVPILPNDNYDAIINSAETLKLIRGLQQIDGLSDTDILPILSDIHKIFSKKAANIVDRTKSIETVYRELYTFYSTIKTLNNSMMATYQNISTNVVDINQIKNFTGNIIERNIETANIFIKEMIIVFQKFGLHADNIQTIRKKISNSKSRLVDFGSYMTEAKNKLRGFQNVIDTQHADIVLDPTISATNILPDYLKEFFKTYVENYTNKLSNASSSVVKYFSFEKDEDYVTDQQIQLLRKKNELNIMMDFVYENFRSRQSSDLEGLYFDDPSAIRVTNNFYNLSSGLFVRITYLNEKMLKLFPNITNRIDIGSDLKDILDVLWIPNINALKKITESYLLNIDKNGLNSIENNNLIKRVVKFYQKRIELIKINRLSNATKLSNIDGNKYDDINNEINKLLEKYLVSDDNEKLNNLSKLTDYLLDMNDVDLKKKNLIDYLNDALDRIYKLRGYSKISRGYDEILNPIDANIIVNLITDQFNRMISNIFNIYYETLLENYEYLSSLSLINNQSNPYFDRIRNSQRELVLLGTQPRAIQAYPDYSNLDRINVILLPDRLSSSYSPDKIVSADFKKLSHNSMNTKDNGVDRPFTLTSSNNVTILNLIKNSYNLFEKSSINVLSLMDELTNNNVKINNSTGWDLSIKYSIVQNNQQLFLNPFKYVTNNIIMDTSTGYTGPDQLLLNTNKLTTIIANDYNTTGNLYIFIPSYDLDRITYNATGPHTYTCNSPYKYMIPINQMDIDISINNRSDLTAGNIVQIRKLVSTGKILIDFMSRLNPLVKNIADLNAETTTWNAPTTVTDPLFTSRKESKFVLVSALTIVQKIEEQIRLDGDKYFGIKSVLIPDQVAVTNALAAVNGADPLDGTFNNTVDKIWIFTRKLINAWYSLFAHMLSSFILNRSVKSIIDITRLSGDNFDLKKLSLIDFIPYVKDISNFGKNVDDELKQKKIQLSTDKSKYSASIKQGPNKIDTLTINDMKFDQYYRNSGKSTDVYTLIAIIDENTYPIIEPEFKRIETATNKIVRLVDMSEELLSPFYIRDELDHGIGIMTGSNKKKEKLIEVLTNYRNFFMDKIGSQFNRAEFLSEFAVVDPIILNYFNDIIVDINTNSSRPMTDPRNVPDRIISNGNYDSAINLLNHPNKTEDYQFLAKDFYQTGNIDDIIKMFITDAYQIIFDRILNMLDDYMAELDINIQNTMIVNFTTFREVFKTYFTTKHISTLLNPNYLESSISIVGSDDNDVYVKYMLFAEDKYSRSKDLIDDVDNVISTTLEHVKENLVRYYSKEMDTYQKLIKLDKNQSMLVNQIRFDISSRISKLRNIVQTISRVMFNDQFKKYAFVNNTRLLEHLGNAIGNYETIINMIQSKIYSIVTKNNRHILTLAQINNYQAFKSTINKTINGQNVVTNFYRTMSFGIAEFYYDILKSIMECMESTDFDKMRNVEAYLYEYHYITIRRCYNLFKWIRLDYVPLKESEDEGKLVGTYTPIIAKKIRTMDTRGDINSVMLEFHGLKKYLDDYNAVIMDKVQIHLRINDFNLIPLIEEYNNKIKRKALQNGTNQDDLEYAIDYDVRDAKYLNKWKKNKIVFSNKNNNMRVNFDAMDKIYRFDNGISKEFNVYYQDLYQKMQAPNTGIEFNRIYNTLTFPESDVIANYMSIAPNIRSNKGTVIMTYGYSGVGKSASLFGRSARGDDPGSGGILQATLGYFSKVEIYFRIYEIYGLGTQYNYTWNPKNNDGTPNCYPDFYQCLIHHIIDNTGSVLKSVDRQVYTNRHDMMSYIMDLKNPGRSGPGFVVKNTGDPNLGGTKGYATYFDAANQLINSTYVKINSSQYNDFDSFVKNVENMRESGLTIHRLLKHVISQVKGTINNPQSSRSILVYDFQVNTNPDDLTNKIYIPFLIYDLPGKEDIYRTYVETNLDDATTDKAIKNVFKDINNDPGKGIKSSMVLNPILVPAFKNYIEPIITFLKNISTKMNSTIQKNIIGEILAYDVTNFYYEKIRGNSYEYRENGIPYSIGLFYDSARLTGITDFNELFNIDKLNQTFINGTGDFLLGTLGVVNGLIGLFPSNIRGKNNVSKELFVLVAIVTMAILIKHQYFDVVVEIINIVANTDLKSGIGGDWNINKIYAFFEAYYINENVIGLLEYLITNVLKQPESGIEPQSTISENMDTTINKNYKITNKYRNLYNALKNSPTGKVDNDYHLNVTPDLIDKNLEINKNLIREREIDQFISNNDIDTSLNKYGIFAEENDPLNSSYSKMGNVLSFENRGLYNSNRIFRNGKIDGCQDSNNNVNASLLFDPKSAIKGTITSITEKNRPLLQDFIEPYEQKISFYYVFFVVSNNLSTQKAEEQIKLINNSMPFINKMNPSLKKKTCAQ